MTDKVKENFGPKLFGQKRTRIIVHLLMKTINGFPKIVFYLSLIILAYFMFTYFTGRISLNNSTEYAQFSGTIGLLLAVLIGYYFRSAQHEAFTDNFLLDKRVDAILSLIDKTKVSLIVYSTKFDSEVYENEKIISSLSNLPLNVKFEFFITGETVDSRSKKFLNFCKKRNIHINSVKGKTSENVIISDNRHIRIELFPEFERDPKQGKLASIFYFDPAFVSHYKDAFLPNK